ncbi:MAG TPA: hypothetical protein VN643_11960 [Pyrinomonadaceae bacterium]|nr:hypothetical protein [Pyrinomonadaceae bacterium]
MTRILRLLAVLLFIVLIIAGWFWWDRPTPVDMAAYVPGDSLVYLEANNLLDIAGAIGATDSWQKLGPQAGIKLPEQKNSWSSYLVRLTGIGSVPTVVATRAQVAFVMLELSSTGQGDALEFNSQAALIIETHTSERRIKPALESLLNDFTKKAYGNPKLEQINIEGHQASRWTSPDGQRKIVASAEGSVIMIGNNEKAVAACLAVRSGQRPSLLHRPELEEMRARLNGNDALAFGYSASPNAARLISETAPIVFGRLTQITEFQKLLTTGTAKLVGNIGWSARASKGGIEDNYFIGLKPEVLARLRPAFRGTQTNFLGGWELLPPEVFSVTSYNIREPAVAWDQFNATVSSQLDIVSAVVFTTAFKALLAPYGIDDPDAFLKAVKPDLLTVRMEAQSERSLIIAGIASPETLRQFVSRRFGAGAKSEKIGDAELFLSEDGDFAASFAGDYFLLGAPEDVRRCLNTRASHSNLASSSERLEALSHYFEKPNLSSIVTFSKDNERASSLVTSLTVFRGAGVANPTELDRVIQKLPYSVTETSLGDSGIERRTRSDFGQFGFLISYLAPRSSSSPTAPSR